MTSVQVECTAQILQDERIHASSCFGSRSDFCVYGALSIGLHAAQQPVPQGQGGPAPGRQGGQGGSQGSGPQNVIGGVGQDNPAQGGGQGQAGRQGGGGGGRGRAAGPPPKPAPRDANGRAILWSFTPQEKGVWLPGSGITITTPIAKYDTIPFQPWAKALYDFRQTNELEPHTRCKASGFSREFETPYGVEFVNLPELNRIYIFDIGGPHTYRTIYMDGRSHPADLKPSYYGHSIGWWEGDTLVVDTVGFNETFWLDRRGLPHTNKLHTEERFTRINYNEIKYDTSLTIRARTPRRGRVGSTCAGNRAPSCSNMCASRRTTPAS